MMVTFFYVSHLGVEAASSCLFLRIRYNCRQFAVLAKLLQKIWASWDSGSSFKITVPNLQFSRFVPVCLRNMPGAVACSTAGVTSSNSWINVLHSEFYDSREACITISNNKTWRAIARLELVGNVCHTISTCCDEWALTLSVGNC